MKRTILFVILILSFILTRPTAAQQTPEANAACNPASLIKTAAVLTSTGDNGKDMAVLLDLSQQISAENVVCNGLTFSGKGTTVGDPFDLPAGTYRMKFTFTQNIPTYVAAIRGIGDVPCSDDVTNDDPVAFLSADTTCRAVLDVHVYDSTDVPWTMTFEPLK